MKSGPSITHYPDVTRVEVIGYPHGRVHGNTTVENVGVSIQDDGRTLKVFYHDLSNRQRSLDDMPMEELKEHINTIVYGNSGERGILKDIDSADEGLCLVLFEEYPEPMHVFLSSLFVKVSDDNKDDEQDDEQESSDDVTTSEDPRIAHFRTLFHETRFEKQLATIRGNKETAAVWNYVCGEIEDILDGVKDM